MNMPTTSGNKYNSKTPIIITAQTVPMNRMTPKYIAAGNGMVFTTKLGQALAALCTLLLLTPGCRRPPATTTPARVYGRTEGPRPNDGIKERQGPSKEKGPPSLGRVGQVCVMFQREPKPLYQNPWGHWLRKRHRDRLK
jgi:hypothetical protein